MYFRQSKIKYEKLLDSKNILASIVLFRQYGNKIQLLIEKRALPPKIHSSSIPGGHVEKNEDIREACVRELKEETNVSFPIDKLVYIGHSERENNRDKLDYIYAGIYRGNAVLKAADDAEAVEWCDVDNLPILIFDQMYYVRKAYSHFFGVELPERNPPGFLIVFEGLDGSGKSFLTNALIEYFDNQNQKVTVSHWNSGDITQKSIKKLKNSIQKTPELYSLLHAADMQERYDNEIRPALDEGQIVICDRYYYTSMARDAARDADLSKLSHIYGNYRKPDIIFHCSSPIKICIERSKFKGLSYYSSGMDSNLHENQNKNIYRYYQLINKYYHEILPQENGYNKINTNQEESKAKEKVCDIVDNIMNYKKYKELELKINSK